MPFYDHDDRTITETDTSSRWLPGLSLGALQRLRWWLERSSWRQIRFIDEIAMHSYLLYTVFNTLRPRQDDCLFSDDILKCIFLNGNSWIPNKTSWKYVAWRLIDNKPSMVQIMGCRPAGDNPIIWTNDGIAYWRIYCETRPRWVRDGEAIILATYTFQWLYRYCIRIYCILCFRNITLIVDLCAIYSYYCPYEHDLLPMRFKCLYILPLCIYSSMYWKSGTSDLLVLMLFVLQWTGYK